jgi:translation elongation factor EF-1alpha
MEEVGYVTHSYLKISVAIVEDTGELNFGDTIVMEKGYKRVEQIVESMQIEHSPISQARPGDVIGLKVNEGVPVGAKVL